MGSSDQEIRFQPATIHATTEVVMTSAQQVLDTAQWRFGGAVSVLSGLAGWETAVALREAAVAAAELTGRQAERTRAHVEMLTDDLDLVLRTDASIADVYGSVVRG